MKAGRIKKAVREITHNGWMTLKVWLSSISDQTAEQNDLKFSTLK